MSILGTEPFTQIAWPNEKHQPIFLFLISYIQTLFLVPTPPTLI